MYSNCAYNVKMTYVGLLCYLIFLENYTKKYILQKKKKKLAVAGLKVNLKQHVHLRLPFGYSDNTAVRCTVTAG